MAKYYLDYSTLTKEKYEDVDTVAQGIKKAYNYMKNHPRQKSVAIMRTSDYTHVCSVERGKVDDKTQIYLREDRKDGQRYSLFKSDGSRGKSIQYNRSTDSFVTKRY